MSFGLSKGVGRGQNGRGRGWNRDFGQVQIGMNGQKMLDNGSKNRNAIPGSSVDDGFVNDWSNN